MQEIGRGLKQLGGTPSYTGAGVATGKGGLRKKF